MRRRGFVIAGLAALLLASEQSAGQQAQSKIPRVGILTSAENERSPILVAFKEGLLDLGYVEGRNIILEFRFGRGDPSRGPQLATELVALPVDVIVAEGFTPDAVAATDHRGIDRRARTGPDEGERDPD